MTFHRLRRAAYMTALAHPFNVIGNALIVTVLLCLIVPGPTPVLTQVLTFGGGVVLFFALLTYLQAREDQLTEEENAWLDDLNR